MPPCEALLSHFSKLKAIIQGWQWQMLNQGASFSVSLGLLCTPKETLEEVQPYCGIYFLVWASGLPYKNTALRIMAGKDVLWLLPHGYQAL